MNHKRLDQLRELLKVDPTDPFLHYGVAMEHLSGEELGPALDKFRYVHEHFPNYVPNYYQYGKLLFEIGRGEQSVEVLEKGQEITRLTGDEHAFSEISTLLEDVRDAVED